MQRIAWLALLLMAACGSDAAAPAEDAGSHADAASAEDAGAQQEAGKVDTGAFDGTLRFEDQGRVFEPTVVFEDSVVEVPASDPSAILDGSRILMTYTCVDFAVDPPATQICEVESADGRVWENDRVVLRGGLRDSRYAYEGSELVVHEGQKTLLASWYPAPEHAGVTYGFPATLASHEETAIGYEYLRDVLTPAPGPDADAIYSPAVEADAGVYWMVYAATCYPRAGVDCGDGSGVSLGWARSSAPAESWERIESPAIEGYADWTGIFVAEPELLRLQDRWFLFLTGFESIEGEEKPTAIGYATSVDPRGPFELHPEPIVRAEEVGARFVVAPTAVVVGDEILLLYTWLGDDELQRIALTVGRFE